MANRADIPPYSYVYDHQRWRGTESVPAGLHVRSNPSLGTAGKSERSTTSDIYDYIDDNICYEGASRQNETYNDQETRRRLQGGKLDRVSRNPPCGCLMAAVIIVITLVGFAVFLVIHFTGIVYKFIH